MKVQEGRTVQSGQAEIYYEDYGPREAPAIMLVPGGDETQIQYYQNIPALVNAGYRVLAMNLRGHWLSPCPPIYCHYKYYPDDFIAILDDAGIDRCVMMCCSLGGFGGMRLAVHHPDRVMALALCGSAAGVWSEENRATNTRAWAQIVRMAGRGKSRPADFSSPRNFLDRYLCLLGSEDGMMSAPMTVLVAMEDDRFWLKPEEFGEYEVPTVLIGGDTDDFLGRGFQRHLQTLIPGSELSEFQDCGHRPFWTHPDKFNAALISWLEQKGIYGTQHQQSKRT